MFQITPMVKNLLIINVVIHVIFYFLGELGESLKWGILSAHSLYSDSFYIFQQVTYMWLHGSSGHLLGNMLGLFFFGPMLENVWGYKKFLIFYLVVGIGAGLIYMGTETYDGYKMKSQAETYMNSPNPDGFAILIIKQRVSNLGTSYNGKSVTLDELSDIYYDNPDNTNIKFQTKSIVEELYHGLVNRPRMIGASGAILGIILAFGILFHDREIQLLFFPIPFKAIYLALVYGTYQIYQAFTHANDGTSYVTHLGGMIMAFIILNYWKKKHGTFY